MKEKFAPTIVLGVLCLVAALLLAAVNGVTAPQIEAITKANADAARQEVMPEASGFTLVDGNYVEGVTEVYQSDNETGYVITSASKGFGGNITVMVAVQPDGTIEAIKVTDASNETPGLGSKTTLPDHAAKFAGKSTIQMTDKGDAATYVAPVTGASYSSKGVFNAVSAALEQFAQLGGAQ